MVSFKSRSLYLREKVIGTHRIGGGVGPRIGLDAVEKKKNHFITATGN